MRVKLLVGLAGPTTLSPGDEAEFSEDEALRLIAARFAVPAEEAPADPVPKLERAVSRKAKERR